MTHNIFSVKTDYVFSILLMGGETYFSASTLYVVLKENPKKGTHRVH